MPSIKNVIGICYDIDIEFEYILPVLKKKNNPYEYKYVISYGKEIILFTMYYGENSFFVIFLH